MSSGGTLLVGERLDVGSILHLSTLVVAANVTGNDLRTIEDADFLLRGHDAQAAAHIGMRNGIIVEIETGVRRLADGNGGQGRPGKRVVWQRQEVGLLQLEGLPDSHVEAGAQSVGGHARYPNVGLGIEIVEILEAAGCKEVVADIANGALDAAFLIAARDCDRTGSYR